MLGEESILMLMFTSDKMLLFGSPHKDQIQYLLGDDITHILIQKTKRTNNCFQVFPRVTLNAALIIDYLKFNAYNHTSGLSVAHLKSADCDLDSMVLDTQLFTLLRSTDHQCLKDSMVMYLKVGYSDKDRKLLLR